MKDLIGSKPVEAFGEADRKIGKGRELAAKLQSLGKYIGRDVRVTVKFRAFSTTTGKERSVKKVVKLRPSSANEIRGKYFEVIRNKLAEWRQESEDNPDAGGWYDDITVVASGFTVALVEGAGARPRAQYVKVRGVNRFKKTNGKWQKRRGKKWVKSSRAEMLKATTKGNRAKKAKASKARR